MKNTSLLRTAYVAGAIPDFTFGLLLMAFPSLCMWIYGIDIVLSPTIRFWMAYAGMAIFSWTAFLIWGLRQLDERKFVALATAFVVFGFVIIEIVDVAFGIVSVVNMILLCAIQFALITLLLVGYSKA